ncbi:CHY_zinc finger domain-containing protein [Hexamita inflata]|uniref:CHY_zinc finger domain-containing protein n=1 Tax=Hexamita inflata TaxID=28002 RepID=A0ABP1L192_9EUKA
MNCQQQNRVIVAQVFSIKTDLMLVDDIENQDIIKTFTFDILSEERYDLQQLLNKCFPHQLKSVYNPAMSDFENMEDFNEYSLLNVDKMDIIYIKYFEQSGIGCDHYITNCALQCDQCSNFYCCRFCHDEAESHKLNRAVSNIRCLICNTAQPISPSCQACLTPFAIYFCPICKIFSDVSTESKPRFHCAQCDSCVNGLQNKMIHCSKCNCCLKKTDVNSHVCEQPELCCVCMQQLTESTTPFVLMECRHWIHQRCYQELLQKNIFSCPMCRKFIVTKEEREKVLNLVKERYQRTIIPRYMGQNVKVHCMDCGKNSVHAEHPLCYFCAHCGLFNVELIEYVEQKPDHNEIQPVSFNTENIRKVLINQYGYELEVQLNAALIKKMNQLLIQPEIVDKVVEILNSDILPGNFDEFLGRVIKEVEEEEWGEGEIMYEEWEEEEEGQENSEQLQEKEFEGDVDSK